MGKVVAIATGVGDVVVGAAAVRMVWVWWRLAAALMLGAAVVFLLGADALYGTDLIHGIWESGGPIDVGILIAFGLAGTASLAPSMARVGAYSAADHHIGVLRLAALAIALMVAPTALLAEATPGPVRTPFAIAIVSAAIGLLFLIRLAVSVRAHNRELKREQSMREHARRVGLAVSTGEVTASLGTALTEMAGATPGAVRILTDDAPPADLRPGQRELRVHIDDDPLDTVFRAGVRSFSFVAERRDLIDLDENLRALSEQAMIALHRIDLADRVRESRIEQDVLAHRASHDGLTGLANGDLFREELRMARRDADGTAYTAVLFIDLDDFKVINDQLGHEVGDGVLVICAQRIRACLRRSDLGARLGGDEFAVLLRNLAGEEDARRVADRITGVLAEPARVSGIPVDGRASVGFAVARTPAEHDGLLRSADTALYAAKAAGKGRWQGYDPTMQTPMRRAADLRTELQKATTLPRTAWTCTTSRSSICAGGPRSASRR
jgi:diguanylate cyclase (GGDEF)-like protein